MRAENPAALRFIFQDDIYLLQNDKTHAEKIINAPVAETTPEPVVETLAEPIVETPAIQFNYLGGHKKKFLIVVHYPDHQFIADAHLTALESILNRKEYGIDDVAILNIATAPVTDAEELLAYFNPEKLLILGKGSLPAQLAPLVLNQPKQLANCMALYSFSFDDMMSSTENKKTFWEQMKTL
jgi:hypothetical protein